MQKILFPQVEPYNESYLNVSNIHSVWYGQYGNPKGIPILWLHGGPGAGCTDNSARYFNPKVYRIILLDQRGSGKSNPFNELRDNNTQALIKDIEKLRIHLSINKWVILGGSWGSTLALSYTILHFSNVMGLILRGVYTATKREGAHIWYGMRDTFPEAWQELHDFLPESERDDIAKAYYDRIMNSDETISLPAMKAFDKYDTTCAYVAITPQILENSSNDQASMIGVATMFMHYYHNNFFLKENFIEDNLHKITHLPCIIVHGRYDAICKPLTAYNLHKNWAGSILNIIENGGHTAAEPGIAMGIKLAAMQMSKMIKSF